MVVVGIDPGVVPAVCLLNHDGKRTRAQVVSLKGEQAVHSGSFEDELVRLLRNSTADKAIVEHVGPVAGQGLSSTARFMVAWGLIRGVLAGLEIPYVTVTPMVWKRDLLAEKYDLGRDEEDAAKRKEIQKASAVKFVRDNYPAVNLIRGRKTTPDHNMAEAVCLATWGSWHHEWED